MGMLFTQLVKPFVDNPSERFAPSCLRKILLNRTVPRTVRPFQGSHNIRYSKATPPLKGRGGPRSGGEVRPRRQRLPIPQPTHTQQNPQGRIPGGLAFRLESSLSVQGKLSGEVTRCDGSSTLGNGVAVSLASNHSGGQATRANSGVKLVQVEVMTTNC